MVQRLVKESQEAAEVRRTRRKIERDGCIPEHMSTYTTGHGRLLRNPQPCFLSITLSVSLPLVCVDLNVCFGVSFLQNGDITDEEAAEVIKQAQVDVARLNKEAWVLNQAVDSVRSWRDWYIECRENG